MKRTFSILLLIALLMGVLAGCGGSSSDTQETTAESASVSTETTETAETDVTHDLVVGTTQQGGSLDPCGSTNLIGRRLVYDSLFVQDQETGEIVGQLAETWEYIDDCTLKVTLKEGITFSNGEPLTSEDVLYSYERYITSGSQSSSYFVVYDFESSYAEDDRTFYLVTYEPYGPGLSNLLNREIVCKSWCESITSDDAWWDEPVGSGPYEVVENVSGSYTSYALREDYWDTENVPEADTITVKVYSEALTMNIDFENHDLDACFLLDETDASRYLSDPVDGIVMEIRPLYDTYMLCLPEYVEAFDDVRVRQAIAYALDLDAIAEAGMGCLALTATSIIPDGVNYHVDVGSYEYDPEKAKELLDEAGFDYSQTFDMVLVTSTQNQRMCETIQFYLSAVGINMTVSTCDLPTAISAFMNGETDLLLKETTEGAPDLEPNRILDTMLETSTNLPVRITDADFASYLNGALNTIDTDERAEYYRLAQEWMYENCRAIPLCDKGAAYAYHTDVLVDFSPLSIAFPNLRYVTFAY